MGKINFSKEAPVAASPVAPPAPAAPTPVAEPTRTVDVTVERVGQAVGTSTAVQPYQAPPPPAFYDGEDAEGFAPEDLILPHLNIVQKVGDMSTIFTPGTIVLGGQLVLTEAPKELNIGPSFRMIVLGLQPTTFSEKLEGGARGNYFRTEQEVVNAKGTLDWNEAQATDKQLYQRVSIALVAIEKPANLDVASFPYLLDGKNYALALYTMKGTAYTNAARHFKSARKIGHLRTGGYRSAYWTLASQLKKFGSNYAYIPVPRAAESTTEAFRTQLKELLGF